MLFVSSFFAQTAHAAGDDLSISLTPYVIGEIGSLPITASLATSWLAMVVLVVGSLLIARHPAYIPGKVQSTAELLVSSVFRYMSDTLNSDALARKYFPIVMTIFLFILTMNWVGIVPGVDSIGFYGLKGEGSFTPLFYPPATDLNTTIALAIVAFFTIEIAGVLAIGVFRYAGKFINFKSPLGFIIGIIELISELARLVSFSFRLFGNIFAGKVLLTVIMALAVPYIIPIPIMAYEVFVGFIQAFIFAILTLFFIKLAVSEPH